MVNINNYCKYTTLTLIIITFQQKIPTRDEDKKLLLFVFVAVVL